MSAGTLDHQLNAISIEIRCLRELIENRLLSTSPDATPRVRFATEQEREATKAAIQAAIDPSSGKSFTASTLVIYRHRQDFSYNAGDLGWAAAAQVKPGWPSAYAGNYLAALERWLLNPTDEHFAVLKLAQADVRTQRTLVNAKQSDDAELLVDTSHDGILA